MTRSACDAKDIGAALAGSAGFQPATSQAFKKEPAGCRRSQQSAWVRAPAAETLRRGTFDEALSMSTCPLQGVQVLDLTRHLPGPLAAHLLTDLGARVVKVEEPGLGDPVRQSPPRRSGRSALAALLLSG